MLTSKQAAKKPHQRVVDVALAPVVCQGPGFRSITEAAEHQGGKELCTSAQRQCRVLQQGSTMLVEAC